ncbi:AraC family transcriptional regulator [Dielma fastidiosa]|uniref:AraC family transcriptional regulator n=1 Tax=Dielma fastidiosa TaxID=1034346 RepID=UPI003566C7D7
MNFDKLNDFLYMDTKQELWHIKHPDTLSMRYANLEYILKDNEKVFLFDFTDDMLIEDITIMKESRYTKLYPHFHKYMELNYVYSGECTFEINGKILRMTKGDICLLQPGVIHSAKEKGKNDIVINMAFSDKFSTMEMFDTMDNNAIMYNFIKSYFDKSKEQDEYLIYKNMENSLLGNTLLSIYYIYFAERTLNYENMMKQYLKLLFIQLADATIDLAVSNFKEETDEVVYHVLRYISRYYNSCSLQKIADELGYNYNYVSNLIKKKTGQTFTEIKIAQQLEVAKKLVQSSPLPIYKIMERCGFNNQSFFYRKFEDTFGCSPSLMRKK